jgi:hypothetical protein
LPGVAHRIGPYSKPCVLAKIDQRTKEARLLRETRASLAARVGNPSVVQAALIERAAWLTLRLAQLDAKMTEGGAFSDHDNRAYMAWSNGLTRTLARLGMQPAAARQPTLQEYLASKATAA